MSIPLSSGTKSTGKSFRSEYFRTLEELLAAKNAMEEDVCKRRSRLRIVRQFSNGLATMSVEEAQATGASEIVNHLTTYNFLLNRKKRLEQSFTTTRTFVEIKLDTNNPESDILASIQMTKEFNNGCLYDGSEYRNFIKASAGETQIAGGFPVVHHDNGGWAPKLAANMLFPKGCGLTVEEVPYAMAPKSYTLADLESLRDSIKGEDGVKTSKKAVNQLIEALKAKPRGEATQGSNINPHQSERIGSVVENDDSAVRNASIDAWWYYEVKTRDDKTQYVSGTFFTQDINYGENAKVDPQVIAYFDVLFKDPKDWLHLFTMDMEIGGDTGLDSVRGIAEIMYPSSSEIEILLNLMLEGDKERARPQYQIESGAAGDDILAWDRQNDTYVPAGIKAMDQKGSSAPLLTPLQMLMGNVAGLGGGDVSNIRQNGGELRQQAVGRQNTNATMQFGDMADWTLQHEAIAATMVKRCMVGDIQKGARGWHQAMWVRDRLKNLPLKKLFQEEHGRLKYITVRVRRVMGEGGYDSEKSASAFLLSLYPKINPQKRPRILQAAIAIETQDPDLAEDLVEIPLPVINSQKKTAENEYAVICYMASLGMPLALNGDDVSQDHLPVHMQQMIAKLSKHQTRPWDKLDVLEFSALQRHAQDHLEMILGDKDIQDEAFQFIPQFQEIVSAAQALVAQVEQQANLQAEENSMTPKERAELQLKALAEHRKGVELGVRIDANQSLEKQRLAREQHIRRQGFVQEIGNAARLSMEQDRTRAQIAKMGADVNQKQQQIDNPKPTAA